MAGMLDFGAMKERIEACLLYESRVVKSGILFPRLWPEAEADAAGA